ncbi:MAG: ATP-binding cassette domain-containing protein [Oscillospiraceae bacterium]|jgi:D-methionine transport system ATP-binding protein|nr:ATP-binding cassette domain-containing protein [Oscillospiraceae bacterium]
MIELKNLNKTYKTSDHEIVALNNVNLTIQDGEIFGIIGPSGAGKSTLVRCINLLERPTKGDVILDGQNLVRLRQKELLKTRRSIGMIFQSFNLFSQRNTLQNVCYPLEIAGVGKKEAKARALKLLKLVGLADRQKSYPSQLSGGQKQRVAIARALATDPKYLLCDEATSALDPQTTQSILNLLKEINQTLGVTIVVITHEMKVIDQICDRVAVIDSSGIAEVGTVAELFLNPQSETAKELILPASQHAQKKLGSRMLRVIFNGEASEQPVVAELVLSCQAPVNIMFADTKDIDGKAYGQMLLQLPEDERQAEKVIAWLRANNMQFSEEVSQ